MLQIEKDYERLIGRRDRIFEDMKKVSLQIHQAKKKSVHLFWAKKFLLLTVERRQKRISNAVENLITETLRKIFPDRNFTFKLIFEQKRGKIECRPVIMDGRKEHNPEDDLGGSILDIISMAFRIILWKMDRPKKRNVIILDEPFKWLGKGEKREMAGRMLYELSHTLNVQIILITHEPELMRFADKSFQVVHNGIESQVFSERKIKRR